tara:strand:- start:140 stop:376 length:237 start_codon:yes stop_codon:yes gene_type:complete
MLITSVILNIILLLAIIAMILYIGRIQALVIEYHKQWSVWENRYYEASNLVREEFNKHLSIDGLPSKMKIVDFLKNEK